MPQHGRRDRDDVVRHDERAIREPGRRLGRGEQVHRGARTRAERDARELTRPPHERDDVADHLFAHGRGVDERAGRAQVVGRGHLLHVVEGRGRDTLVREAQHRGFVRGVG